MSEITYDATDGTYTVSCTPDEYVQTVTTLEDCGLTYLSQDDNGNVLLAEMNESGGYSYTHR